MSLSDEQLNRITTRLHELTPVLVSDLLISFQNEPVLVERYGASLRDVAEQGVVSFRDILLGALQFNLPNIINQELKWLDKMLVARQIDNHLIEIFLQIFRKRLQSDLKPEESQPVFALFDKINPILTEK